jgi:hypothetical protein
MENKFEFIHGRWLPLEERWDFQSVSGLGSVKVTDRILEVYSVPLVGECFLVRRVKEEPHYSEESKYTQVVRTPKVAYFARVLEAQDPRMTGLRESILGAREEILEKISVALLTSCGKGNWGVCDYFPSGTLKKPDELLMFRTYSEIG